MLLLEENEVKNLFGLKKNNELKRVGLSIVFFIVENKLISCFSLHSLRFLKQIENFFKLIKKYKQKCKLIHEAC